MPPDLLKLAAEVGALPAPAVPEPKPLVPFSVGAPSQDWSGRLRRREGLKEYKQYSRDGASFLLDKDIPLMEGLPEGSAGVAAMRKAIRAGTDEDWTHPQVAVPGDVDLPSLYPSFKRSFTPAIRLPGEPRGGDTWRAGRMHAHKYGPVWLVHEDEHAPQAPRAGALSSPMKLREMLTIESARHLPEAAKAQLRRRKALRPVVVDTPEGKWEREKTSSLQEKLAQNPMPVQPQVDPTGNMWGLAGGAGTLLAGGLAGRAVLPQVAGSRVAQHLLTDAQVATAKQWAARRGALGGAILAAIPAWQVAKMVANSPRRNTAWQHQVFGF